jgi:hypothetical protein
VRPRHKEAVLHSSKKVTNFVGEVGEGAGDPKGFFLYVCKVSHKKNHLLQGASCY